MPKFLATIPLFLAVSSAASASDLNGAGATFPYPLYSKWFEVFQQKTGTKINYQAIGSGAGKTQFKNGVVDFAATDIPFLKAEIAEMGREVEQIPVTGGMVAVVYNLPGIKPQLRLSGEVLAAIYVGHIRRWNHPRIQILNPKVEFPDRGISVTRRSDGSGTTWVFTHFLSATSPYWARKHGVGKTLKWPYGSGGRSGDGIFSIVKSSPGSIGYVELAYAKQNRMQIAAIQNREGLFVSPSGAAGTAAVANSMSALQRDITASVVNAGGAPSYPITKLSYIILDKKRTVGIKRARLRAFLDWAMQSGQKYGPSMDYVTLPVPLVERNLAILKQWK